MGRSLDPVGGQLPISHNPLIRIGYQPPRQKVDLDDLIAQWRKAWELFGLQAFKDLTRLDLSSPQALIMSFGNLLISAVGGQFFNGVLPGAWISDTPRELLGVGDFPDAASVENNPAFAWDGSTVGHLSGFSAVTKPGADGTMRPLRHEVFDCDPGQTIDLAVSAMWEGAVSAAGSKPIRLCVTPYSASGSMISVDDTVIKQIAASGNSGWVRSSLSGSYVVPAGVHRLAVTLRVSEDLTAGTVRFSNVSASMSNKVRMPLIEGLPLINTMLNQINDIFNGVIVTPINEQIQGILDWFRSNIAKTLHLDSNGALPPGHVLSPAGGQNLGQDMLDVVANICNAVFGENRFDWLPVDASQAVSDLKKRADDAYAAANYVAAVQGRPRKSPRWVSTGTRDDVSFPIINAQSLFRPPLGKLVLIPITSEVERVYRSVRFALIGSAANVYVGLYRPNATTGTIVREIDMGDVRPILTGAKIQAFAIPGNGFGVDDGETTFIGVLQVGGTAGEMFTAPNIPTALEAVQEIPLFFTQEGGTGLTALPATVNANVEFTPTWGALGESMLPSAWTDYAAPGSYVYTAPADWVYLDVVGIGAGGGGGGGDGGWNLPGEGGRRGQWNGKRITRGVDCPMGTTQFGLVVPQGGAGAPGKEQNGVDGDPVVVAYATGPSTTQEVFRATGGPRGRLAYGSFYNRDPVGQAAGDFAFGARLFPGGGSAARDQVGKAPGGGGGGGRGGAGGSASGGQYGGYGFCAIKAVV